MYEVCKREGYLHSPCGPLRLFHLAQGGVRDLITSHFTESALLNKRVLLNRHIRGHSSDSSFTTVPKILHNIKFVACMWNCNYSQNQPKPKCN